MSEATTSDEPEDDDIPSADADDVPADAPEPGEDTLENEEVDDVDESDTRGGATSGIRRWMSSESGRKIMPVASGAFVVVGALLILMSLFSRDATPPPAPELGTVATGQLAKAMAVSKEYLTQDTPHTYRRFSAAEAEAADPTLVWNIEKKAVEGEISIRVSGETGIVLATKDASGTVYCIADENAEEEVSKGTVDATKPEQCKGGWG